MSPLISLTALILLAQVSAPDLERALRSVEGDPAQRFAPDVGSAAAQAVGRGASSMEPDELERHLLVAIRGKAQTAIAPHLGRLLAVDGPSLKPALRAAGELVPEERAAMVKALGTAATRPSLSFAWADEDERAARGAIVVLMASSPPSAARDLLRALLRDELTARADWALQVAADLRPTTELVAALLEVEPDLPPALHASMARTLGTFIDQQPQLAGPVVEGLEARPSPALLGAAVAMPPEHWERAIGGVMHVVNELSGSLPGLAPDEVALLVAGIDAAADLRVAELLPRLPELCLPTMPMPVRLAALRALGELGAKEATIIDQLLRYLPEPDPVGTAAFASLRQRSGAGLPPRPVLWQDWRRRTALVAMTAEEHAARLLSERRARHVARTSARLE